MPMLLFGKNLYSGSFLKPKFSDFSIFEVFSIAFCAVQENCISSTVFNRWCNLLKFAPYHVDVRLLVAENDDLKLL